MPNNKSKPTDKKPTLENRVVIPFDDGTIKKGFIKKPARPKPDVKPQPQKPSSSSTKSDSK